MEYIYLVLDVVIYAFEIQKICKSDLHAGILETYESTGITLNIGIYEGEMVFEGNDELGDGVNIASMIHSNR